MNNDEKLIVVNILFSALILAFGVCGHLAGWY
jgi:hypothetical protein